MIHYLTGDLFFNKYKAQAIAHGCNCLGFMGAGIAAAFAQKFPEMKKAYSRLCSKDGESLAGKGFYWDNGDFFVCNLFTQINTGNCAKYEFVKSALTDCKNELNKRQITSLAMPAIGCGIGGLELERVKDIVREVFGDWQGEVYFYEQYRAGQ